MNRILLDTSAYSAAKRNHSGTVAAIETADEVLVPAIVMGELLAGFRKGAAFEKNERDLQRFLALPGVKIASVDEDTAVRYAVIYDGLRRAGTPVSPNDLWIAASAMQHGAALLTADRDFERIPQILVTRLES